MAMSTTPNLRRDPSGVVIIFCIQNFIFSGKAKYGNPSMIMTIPRTHKKNFMISDLPLPTHRIICLKPKV